MLNTRHGGRKPRQLESDRHGDAHSFVLPAGTNMAAGGFLVVWCNAAITEPGLHAGFALGKDGDQIFLFDAATNRVDAIGSASKLLTDLGRVDGLWHLTTPTPNAANLAAFNSICSPTLPSTNGARPALRIGLNFSTALPTRRSRSRHRARRQ